MRISEALKIVRKRNRQKKQTWKYSRTRFLLVTKIGTVRGFYY